MDKMKEFTKNQSNETLLWVYTIILENEKQHYALPMEQRMCNAVVIDELELRGLLRYNEETEEYELIA